MALSVFAYAITQRQPVFFVLGAVIAIDAMLGASILKQVFEDQRVDFETDSSEQAYASLSNESTRTKKFNNRLPDIVMENEMG